MKSKSRAAVYAAAAALGGLGGYLYYALVGCAGGTCPITSDPLISTLYGAVLGALLADLALPQRQKGEQQKKPDRPAGE